MKERSHSNVTFVTTAVHEGRKLFKCDICNYSSSQKCHINTHVESVHEGKKPFKCDFCDYSCSRKDNMNTHVASVHELKDIQMRHLLL